MEWPQLVKLLDSRRYWHSGWAAPERLASGSSHGNEGPRNLLACSLLACARSGETTRRVGQSRRKRGLSGGVTGACPRLERERGLGGVRGLRLAWIVVVVLASTSMTGTISGAAVGRIGGLVIGGLAAMNFGEEGIRVGVALTALARGAGAGGVGGTLSFLGLCGAGGGGGNVEATVRPGGGPGGSFGTLYRAPLTAGGGPGGYWAGHWAQHVLASGHSCQRQHA